MAALLQFPGRPALFDPAPVAFTYLDEDWCANNLAIVRMASDIGQKKEADVRELSARLQNIDGLDELTTELDRVERHLTALADLCRVAKNRLLLVAGRLRPDDGAA